MHPKISSKDLNTWADYLLNHSLGGINSDDVVMLKGEPITWPLLSILQDKIFAAGGLADVNIVAPDNFRGRVWSASIARHGTVEQISRVPAWNEARYRGMNKYIEVLGSEDPDLYANLPEETAKALVRSDELYKEIRLSKHWVLTLFPTEAFAAIEDMTLEEYAHVIVSASTVDPKELEECELPIAELLEKGKKIRIETVHPDDQRDLTLELDISDRFAVTCTGLRNFPDGEVFTSPDARSAEGEIFVDLPVFYDGVTIRGIYLKFEHGVIIDFSALDGFETLRNIIETDEGSHRLGEVALGMNAGIQTALRHPLFVEKVGGTLHIAIGSSYPECFVRDANSESGQLEVGRLRKAGILNQSAQHVDIVADFRPGGCGRAVYVDDVPLQIRENIWVLP